MQDFPHYIDGPIKWRDNVNSCGMLRSILVQADEARAFLFHRARDHALHGVIDSWVMRSTKTRIFTTGRDVLFDSTTRKFMGHYWWFLTTTRCVGIGKSSALDLEHDVFVVNSCDFEKITKKVRLALVSGTVVPVTDGLRPKVLKESTKDRLVVRSPMLRMRPGFPNGLMPCRRTQFAVRKSDCDAFLHVNNCTALDLFTDGFSFDELDRVGYYIIEYPAALLPGDAGIIQWTCNNEGTVWVGEMFRNANREPSLKVLFAYESAAKSYEVEGGIARL